MQLKILRNQLGVGILSAVVAGGIFTILVMSVGRSLWESGTLIQQQSKKFAGLMAVKKLDIAWTDPDACLAALGSFDRTQNSRTVTEAPRFALDASGNPGAQILSPDIWRNGVYTKSATDETHGNFRVTVENQGQTFTKDLPLFLTFNPESGAMDFCSTRVEVEAAPGTCVVPANPFEPIQNLCTTLPQTTLSIAFTIPDGGECPWGVGDNLPARDRYSTARVEQNLPMTLVPTTAHVCDIQFNFSTQPFRYDDVFVFTFDGFILASTGQSTYTRLLNYEGIYRWDWMRYRGSSNNIDRNYCAGQADGRATCSWPATERTGRMSLSYNPEMLYRIAANRNPAEPHHFRFITVGDNNGGRDCHHLPINFTTEVIYVQP